MKSKEIKCLDPVMKYCQECPYGIIEYDSDIETYTDTISACFKTSCIHGLEDTEPTKKNY